MTYLLLVLSIAIWATVGWKVYQALDTNTVQPVARKVVEAVEQDSTPLLLNYKDPFLGGYNVPAQAQIETEPVKRNITSTHSQPQQNSPITPDFQLKGILNIGKSPMAIIQKNNETLTLKIGEAVDGFKITKMSDNMITLSKNGKKYAISIR